LEDHTRNGTIMTEHVVRHEADISRKAAERYSQLTAASERKAAAKDQHLQNRVVGRVRSAIASAVR
jgi:hypothetical protein